MWCESVGESHVSKVDDKIKRKNSRAWHLWMCFAQAVRKHNSFVAYNRMQHRLIYLHLLPFTKHNGNTGGCSSSFFLYVCVIISVTFALFVTYSSIPVYIFNAPPFFRIMFITRSFWPEPQSPSNKNTLFETFCTFWYNGIDTRRHKSICFRTFWRERKYGIEIQRSHFCSVFFFCMFDAPHIRKCHC